MFGTSVAVKSTRDSNTRSISDFGRPAICIDIASTSYIQGCDCPEINASLIAAITWPCFRWRWSRKTSVVKAEGDGRFFSK